MSIDHPKPSLTAARISVNQIKADELERYVRKRVYVETASLRRTVYTLLFAMVVLAVALVLSATMAPKAHADGTFVMCDDGREGIVGEHTSCPFAANVRRVFFAQGQPRQFTAYSPVTDEPYSINCASLVPVTFIDGEVRRAIPCFTNTGAEVVIW